MEKSNAACTPMVPTDLKNPQDVEHLSKEEHNLYRSIIGSLMYIATCTRPDISFAVGKLGEFLHQPTKTHLTAAKRILRYLQGTKNKQITYQNKGNGYKPKLVGYADADFASDPGSRRSISGYLFTYGGSPVSWRGKIQGLVATSTTEAEYISLSECCKMAMVLANIIKDLKNENPFPITPRFSCLDR